MESQGKSKSTCHTNAIRSGVELPVLQQMVGHADGETTKTYAHLDVSDLRNAAGKISAKTAVCSKSATRSEAPSKTVPKSS